jgi:hypothetical protein
MDDDPSEAMKELLVLAVDHGVDSVRDSGGPLIPFVLTELRGERALARFASDTLEDGLAHAVAHVKAMKLEAGDCAVVVYDGYLTTAEGRFDAIYAEGIESNGRVNVLAQRYKSKALLRRFQTVGDVAWIPNTNARLGGTSVP